MVHDDGYDDVGDDVYPIAMIEQIDFYLVQLTLRPFFLYAFKILHILPPIHHVLLLSAFDQFLQHLCH